MTASRPVPPSLLLLLPLYGGLNVLAGFMGNKQGGFGPVAVELGLLAYIGVIAISSTVAELHGRALAHRLVLFGFAPVGAALALIALVLAIPPAPQMDAGRLAAFNLVFAQSPRIMLGGIAAYFVSVFINVRVFSALGMRGGASDGGVMLRGALASAVAQAIDGLIFITIAFYGVFPILPLLAGQIAAKLVLSFTAVPLLIRLGMFIGRRLDAGAGSDRE